MRRYLLFLLAIPLLLTTACTDRQAYRDTSELEKPPTLEIAYQEPTPEKDRKLRKDVFVFLDDSEDPSMLRVKKLFDRSWDLVGDALKKQKIEIKDKNRARGLYFVRYQPNSDSGQVFGNIKFFFFEDEYPEADYQISLVWRDTETLVRASLVNEDFDHDLDDEDAAESEDGSEMLIQALYKALNPESEFEE